MTDKLVIYGDSLADTANASILFSFLDPFANEIYDGGGNKKASNGFTLVEGVLLGLGVPDDDTSSNILDLERIDPFADGIDPSLPITNFAVGGATTGEFGNSTSGLGEAPIGLQQQITSSIKLPSGEAGYLPTLSGLGLDIDVLLICGTNDIFDIYDDTFAEIDGKSFHEILASKSFADDLQLINSVVDSIVTNITTAVERLQAAGVDEIVVVGPLPAGITRLAQGYDQITGLDVSGIFNRISSQANRELSSIYNTTRQAAPSLQTPDVYFVSGTELYSQFTRTTPTPFLQTEQFKQEFFLPLPDLVHPNSDAAVGLGGLAASLIQQNSAFQSFGFA